MKAIKCIRIGFWLCLGVLTSQIHAQTIYQTTVDTPPQPPYSYYYRGSLIELQPSRQLIAIKPTVTFNARALQRYSVMPAPAVPEDRQKLRGYTLYAISAQAESDPTAFQTRLRSLSRSIGGIIQPVFEQGRSLLIPADEIILGFASETSFDDARSFLEPYFSLHGIVRLQTHRLSTFVITIDQPSNGRIYSVCRELSRLAGVAFAEPNHLLVFQPEPIQHAIDGVLPPGDQVVMDEGPPLAGVSPPPPLHPIVSVPVGWTTLVSEDFESASLPAGWSTGIYGGSAQAYWQTTTYKNHSGSRSCYATGGGPDGVSPPGPYPNNAFAWLDTPQLNLAVYEEVYIEVWFYARYENPYYDAGSGQAFIYDDGLVGIYNPSNGMFNYMRLVVAHTGDLTADPTTDNGWRRALVRVPSFLKGPGVHVRFALRSDFSITREGLYIDQVRVVGTTDVDTTPLGNDTYAARIYEIKNVGQIADLGGDSNDLEAHEAWDRSEFEGIDAVSADVTVAVIDTGVDLLHPDLNIVGGFDHDGTAGGEPTEPHGTAVAGNIGAIMDNGIGVIGTAPGVSILAVNYGETNAEVSAAIDTAVSEGAHVLNNSWGWVGAPSADIENAIADAVAAGRILLFAAGNGPDRPPWTYETAFPCNLTDRYDIICVGATSPTDEHKAAASSDGLFGWGSSYMGNGPDVCAPGPWSYTTDQRGAAGYDDSDYISSFGGTSSSTPKVAGIAALMLSVDPHQPPVEIKRILRLTAEDIDAAGFDDKTGAGRVNALQAVSYVWTKPWVVAQSASPVNPVSTTFRLEGTVNPRGSSTSYYFKYGTSPAVGLTTPPVDVGSGTAAVSVSAEVTAADLTSLHYFRLVASNADGIAYSRIQTFVFDGDADGLPDEWERSFFGDLSKTGNADDDNDGLINTAEVANRTDPTDDDTDGDDLPDGWEVDNGLDPLDPTGDEGKDGDFDDDGWSNYEEFTNGTDPNNDMSPLPTPPAAVESLPHVDAGIADAARVPSNTSFAVRLTDAEGIDITDPATVSFSVDDGDNPSYDRDLSHATVRIVKLTADADTAVTHLWVVYDRTRETTSPYDSPFAWETTVFITVRSVDIRDDEASQPFRFRIESQTAHNEANANLPTFASVPPQLGSGYDTCLAITSGDLQGAMIMFDSAEPVQPTFGPLDEIPTLSVPGGSACGIPLNLQPPTVFNTPVAIRIPCPGHDTVDDFNVFVYDGQGWEPAVNSRGDVLSGGESWAVSGSRQNFNNGSPSTIEIQALHFTGAQAGTPGIGAVDQGGGGGGGGCFISTVMP